MTNFYRHHNVLYDMATKSRHCLNLRHWRQHNIIHYARTTTITYYCRAITTDYTNSYNLCYYYQVLPTAPIYYLYRVYYTHCHRTLLHATTLYRYNRNYGVPFIPRYARRLPLADSRTVMNERIGRDRKPFCWYAAAALGIYMRLLRTARCEAHALINGVPVCVIYICVYICIIYCYYYYFYYYTQVSLLLRYCLRR